ncbi:MAG TPA: ATP-binding protein [Candidatus Intestinimonas merdavium]|uniref:ATP-binding protein n=1 Tax=Candidatus Intestinimonas merdavium TaxID=2838622 RepID=A0A9D1Z547_9FIRM|nr:ATP-binding protein [Candidatus Intestinimonas merdavium]
MSKTMRPALLGLSTCRDLLREPLMTKVRDLLDALDGDNGEAALNAYTEIFYKLRQAGKTGLGDWLWDQLRYNESPYPALLDRGGSDPALEEAARRDTETLARLAALDCGGLIDAMTALLPEEFQPVLAALPRWSSHVPFTFESLTDFYQIHGAGLFARYRAFLWSEGALIPVAEPDTPQEEEMMGYGLQREQVIANTRAFLAGKRVNDVLLYGDSGTGKSATVKTLLSIPGFEALRLIEVQKDGLKGMPELIRSLSGRKQRFILFIDDLAFDQDDHTYSVVKTILEGGLERRPVNVAIYATSNRRLLVRQTFSDRAGDEVDRQETIQEKTALSDRFGLRIPYLALSKAEFLDLVQSLADQRGLAMDREELRRRAIQWDMRFPSRTPRGARQFLASLQMD